MFKPRRRSSPRQAFESVVLILLSVFFVFAYPTQKSPNADCSRYFLGVLVGSPSLRLAESEKRTIFRMHLENALKDMRLDEEDKVKNKECCRAF